MSAQPLLAVKDVEKRFGTVRALRGVTFTIQHGERVLLLGSNGSGKSTLLRIISGLLRPTRGTVTVAGAPARSSSPATLGYMGHGLQIFGDLSVAENLDLFSVSAAERIDVRSHLDRWGLTAVANQRIQTLSRGYQARVALARALLHDPELVILDEPTANLDEPAVRVLLELLTTPRRNGGARAAVLASHDAARLNKIADRTLTLVAGKIISLPAEDGEQR